MWKKINWSIALPIALIVLALFLSSWLLREKPTMSRGEHRAPPVTVEVATAEYGRYPLTVTALGRVSAREMVELEPQVEGRVEWLDYDLGPGSTLREGEELLQIEQEPYQLALQSARSTLAERRAELQQEEGQRRVAQEEFALLGSDLPAADSALVLREPQLAAARARVDAAEADVSLARRDLRLTRLSAPFNALLVSRSVDIGDRVGPGTVLYTLAGADRFQIEVEVPPSQLRQLNAPGAEVRIHGSQWAENEYRQGQFVRVIPVLEEQGRLATVLVELKDPLGIEDPDLPPLLLNDLARVEITGRADGQQVRIPITALHDGDVVWVVENGKVRIQPVKIAHLTETHVVLESGLQGGETLITTRLAAVSNGMPVRTVEEARAASGSHGDDRRNGESPGLPTDSGKPQADPDPGKAARPKVPPEESSNHGPADRLRQGGERG
ncbi:efflux RND transporter periplasmic adaptor subunit [Microbulbifer celer]|uniref:Efflux RND transporter periplasmic adaptor subunit n=1 Tax=Microbulbifer celer TaxID=435905 RepID=A0ABW3U6K5_9GAMM|nr:efflux RND transporter periplasmic adaptor subunit [Microbulbifer celer]UFN58680.1 efflux RND transporter periplasmic adaptor subunit [Microbulbifer celer]